MFRTTSSRLRFLSAFSAAALMAGCITVGGGSSSDEDECDSDDDCAGDRICSAGECVWPGSGGTSSGGTSSGGRGGTASGGSAAGGTSGILTACDWYCDVAVPCGDLSRTECEEDCDYFYAQTVACASAFEEMAHCLRPYANDCEGADACTPETNALVSICAGEGECPYTNDGECDEPNICAPGTDADDCNAACESTNDGECDEPEGLDICPEGSDVTDCACFDEPGNTCEWACDGECDESSSLCEAGTDTRDCAAYPPP
jgi:hypothetical protein